MNHEGRDETTERCHGCGERYFRLAGGLCLRCLGDPPARAAERRRVIAYARTHPRASLAVAATATGVSPARVTELVEAGHLVAQGARRADAVAPRVGGAGRFPTPTAPAALGVIGSPATSDI